MFCKSGKPSLPHATKWFMLSYSRTSWERLYICNISEIQTHLSQPLTMILFFIYSSMSLSLTLMSVSQFSHSVVSNSLRPQESQHARPPCPSPTPGVYSNSCPSSWWCHPAISFSVAPSPPAPNPSQNQGLFQWVSSSHEVAKLLEFQLQHQSFQWTPRTDLL